MKGVLVVGLATIAITAMTAAGAAAGAAQADQPPKCAHAKLVSVVCPDPKGGPPEGPDPGAVIVVPRAGEHPS